MDYNTHHTARHMICHICELNDAIFGCPFNKEKTDRAVKEPEKYLKELKKEKNKLAEELENFSYVMRENGLEADYQVSSLPKRITAYAYHYFNDRSFTYLEKINFQAEATPANEIQLIPGKAYQMQLVAVAALEDLNVAIARLQDFIDSKNAKDCKSKKRK